MVRIRDHGFGSLKIKGGSGSGLMFFLYRKVRFSLSKKSEFGVERKIMNKSKETTSTFRFQSECYFRVILESKGLKDMKTPICRPSIHWDGFVFARQLRELV